MKLKYRGKNAIVTGACGGMGLDVTKKLLENKIRTLMLDIKDPPINFIKKNKCNKRWHTCLEWKYDSLWKLK